MKAAKTPEHYMQQVLALAADALEQGEFPIAAIVVLDDEMIAQATASEQREKRFLGHAELVALEEADRKHLAFDERARARLFTNLEPCLMRMGAAMSFFLGEIVYGLESPGDGAVELAGIGSERKRTSRAIRSPRLGVE